MMHAKGYPKVTLRDEKGMVLVVGLLLIVVLMLLGTTAVLTSTTDMKISANYKTSNEAFYIAEAGIERARGKLRTDAVTYTISQLLAARVGANNVLSNSTNIANFYANGIVTDDVAYIAATSFGSGTYQVYLTNDGTPDVVTSITDTNLQVTLTSIGQGANNSLAIVQQVVKQLTLPPLPGAIVLPGPDVVFNGGNSNASGVEGGIESAITTTSDAARTSVVNQLTSIGRIGNYTCDTPPCINNEESTIDPTWTSVSDVEDLYTTLKSVADVVLTGPATLTAAQVGTTADRRIVVVDGNATLGPVNGAGILIVTGQLTLDGNFNYHGLIMCIGQGSLLRSGGGNGEIEGSIFVAKTRDASDNLLASLGNPTFNTNGGGNSDIEYDAAQLSMPSGGRTFTKKLWLQL